MDEKLIPVIDFARLYHTEPAFILALHEYELIEVITIEQKVFIHADQIARVEKLIRLHDELNLNLEGVDVISHLLHRIESLQQEMILLKNKLRRFDE
jgi:MerR HTH family regulatory protein